MAPRIRVWYTSVKQAYRLLLRVVGIVRMARVSSRSVKDPVEAGRALAEAIASETARRDITQDAASQIIGTTQQTFGKWVNGRTRPSDEHIPALARYLGMTEAKVLELRGPTRTDPRDRLLLRRRVEVLERRMEEQAQVAQDLLRRLEGVAQRLDALAPRDD